ncbi:poly(A) RNA polymerase GLD2 isoform X1 [Alosa sapidissima]|uniref:poly(A) RNA polymerase GLD2 isoform X1 n=1 Tax=Alosa sapidissima TaxID=34773 RepID=UPI001C08B1B9|nr:poly(A) RNA polymerase GLD2 isoform X1 [Alosa sapidissima]
MFSRSPGFPHKQRQNNGLLNQFPGPPIFSQQQLVEVQRNRTNSNSHGLPFCLPVIPPYQWNSAHRTPPPVPQGSPLAKGRKRRGDDHSQYELKRQCYSPPGPYIRPAATASRSPLPTRLETARAAGTFPSDVHSRASTPLSSPTPAVPSLGEASQDNDLISLRSAAKDKLSQQILELYVSCEQQDDDLERKELCRAQLQRDIQRLFPYSRIYLAGSSLNGFGSRSSDADLCLVIQEGSVNQKDAVHVLSLVQKFCYTLSYIDRPQLIRAKVPILKFRDKVSGVEFDLNVNNIVGIRNTFLLRTYAYIEKRVRPIVLVIKKWASYYRINDASRGTLSSYTLVLMVLHYLQTLPEPVIPCLQKDYPECFDPSMDIHLVPSEPRNIPPFISKNQFTLGELFLGFLKYYATVFKWDKHVISVRQAKVIPKTNCTDWRKFICVEEPFNGTNTARAVHQKDKFEAIKSQFHASWQVLQLRRDLNSVLPLQRSKQKR